MWEHLLLDRFFLILAFGGAAAEWGLASWALGVRGPLLLHLAGPLLLGALNWLAAAHLARTPPPGPVLHRLGRVLLPPAFASLVALGPLLAVGALWGLVHALGALRVEAGVVAAGPAGALVGVGFRLLAGTAVVATLGAVLHGYVRGYRRLAVTRLTLPLPDLPPALAGLRVVQVSDLHLGALADRAALREALDRVLALDPDLVCVTGDLVDSSATDLDAWMPELARLTARHGVYAILGNHDREAGADRVAAAVRRWTSWRLLRDETAAVEIAGARLHVAGIEDRGGPRPRRLAAVLRALPPREPALVLIHHPHLFPAVAAGGARLVLAGHTHGGQLAVPGLPRLNVARLANLRWDAGLFACDGALLHVNRGLGTSGQRVRVGVPREITELVLVPAAARAA